VEATIVQVPTYILGVPLAVAVENAYETRHGDSIIIRSSLRGQVLLRHRQRQNTRHHLLVPRSRTRLSRWQE
jgi:hypothetical protein